MKLFLLIALMASQALVVAALLRSQWRRGNYATLISWWRGASHSARCFVFAIALTAVAYGSDKMLGGHIDQGLRFLNGAVASLCTNVFTSHEQLTGYAASSVRTNETHDLTMPDNAQLAERIMRRGAHNDGAWFFDAYTNRLARDGLDIGNPIWIHTDGTVTLRSPAPGILIQELSQISVYSNITVYAPLQGSYGFLPAGNCPDFIPSKIWTATTDRGSRVVTWEGARLGRDVAQPVSFQAEFHDNGEVTYRYDTFPTNGIVTGLFRNGVALAFNSESQQSLMEFMGFQGSPEYANILPQNISTIHLSYIGDLGDGAGDSDGDGLTDWEEIKRHHTDPHDADTDGDGLADGEDPEPREWDADGDGVPDGEHPDAWGNNAIFGENAGTTNVVISVIKGMSRRVRGGGLRGGADDKDHESGLLEIGGVRIPLFQGDSIALSLSTGVYIPYRLHIIGSLPVELSIDILGAGGLWCDKPDLFSENTFYSSMSGRLALPIISLDMVPLGLSHCVHEHPGYRDFSVSLTPMAWDLASASATITGFEQVGGNLRLSVADNPTSIAHGTVTLETPWLRRGTLEASATIHRCEYDDHTGGCPLCDQQPDNNPGHDASGVNMDIAKDEYPVLRGAASPVLVELSGNSSSPADWSISPRGDAMLYAYPGDEGAYEVADTSFVWVSAGSNTSYTVTARHHEANDVYDTATVTPVEVKLELLWETRNKTNQIFNPTPKDDDTGNLAVLEKEGDYSYAAPRNNLYVVANPSNDTFDITAHLNVTPSRLADKVVCKAFSATGPIDGSDTELDSANKAVMEIPAPTTAETVSYSIRAGIEMDGESGISHDETIGLEVYRATNDVPKYAVLRGLTGAQYQWHYNQAHRLVHLLGDAPPAEIAVHSRSFLALFMYKGQSSRILPDYSYSTSQQVLIGAKALGSGFTEWLTHNSGADFNESDVAYITEFTWNDDTEVAQFMAQRTPFAPKTFLPSYQSGTQPPPTPSFDPVYQLTQTGGELLDFYNAVIRSTAEDLLSTATNGASLTFPLGGGWYEMPCSNAPSLFASESPEWVAPSTQCVGVDDHHGGFSALYEQNVSGTTAFYDYDAFGTVGRGRIVNPRYQFTVTKMEYVWPLPTEYKVTSINFACDIQDLYDFNYEDSALSSHGAALQIGYANGNNPDSRDYGKIYRHVIHILTTYRNPFSLYP